MTLLLTANDDQQLNHCGRLLELGGTVALPTETLYGLAANAKNAVAVRHVYQTLARPMQHPSAVNIGCVDQLKHWAHGIPAQAYQLVEAFWPGPLTLILQRHPHVSPLITGGSHSIAIRLPAQIGVQELLTKYNLGVIAPPACLKGQSLPISADEVKMQLNGSIDAILDGGPCHVARASTVLDLSSPDGVYKVRRTGPISSAQLTKVLGQAVIGSNN